MSNSPDPTPAEPQSSPPSPRRPYSTLIKVATGLGAVVVTGAIVAVVWGDRLINTYVLPRVEDEIEKTIGRPIELGDVQRLTFWGVRLGETLIPPIETDETSITVEAVELDVGLRSLIFEQVIGFDLLIVRPHVDLVQGTDAKWIDLVLPEPPEEESRIALEIQSLTVQDASLTASTRIQNPDTLVAREPFDARSVDIEAEFFGEETQQVAFTVTGDVESGGFEIQGEGDLDDKAIQANIRAQDLPTTGINLVLPTLMGVSSGVLNSNLTVAADLTEDNQLDLDSVDLQGTARFREGEVFIKDVPAPVRNIQSQLRFRDQQVTVEETSLQLADITLLAAGNVDLQTGYDLTAQIPEIAIADLQSLAEFDLPVPVVGKFQLDTQVTGPTMDPQIIGRLVNRQLVQVDKVGLATVTADFALNQERFVLRELRAVPTEGGVILAQGQADLTDLSDPQFELTAQVDVPVDPFAALYGVALPTDVTVGSLTADVEAAGNLEAQTALARWQLSESSFPGSGELTLADNRLVLDNTRLQVANGTITANAVAELATGDWQAIATTSQVPIDQFTNQASGLLTANIEAAGNLYDFDLATIQAAGDATLTDAVVQVTATSDPLLPRGDWTTTFAWAGDRIAVQSFNAPGVQADGTIGVDFDQPIPIGDLALNVDLRRFDLRPLNSLVPAPASDYVELAGFTNFSGQISGNLQNPQINGTARLDQLALNQLTFETLRGPVALSLAEGGEVGLQGTSDRIQLAVNADPWPVAFEVRNQDFVVSGYGEDRQLYADVKQFPLGQLNIQPAADYGLGTVTGLVDASIEADLADFSNPNASGTLTVSQPGLDPVEAERLTADFRYVNQVATLERGELLLDNSRYLLTAQATLQPEIQYEGELTIVEGRIEDLVAIAQEIDLSAFGVGASPGIATGSAADLDTVPVGLPIASFLEQLEAFIAFEEAQPDDTDSGVRVAIPPLESLSGGFAGTIAVAGRSSALADVTADFDLQGSGWQWGPYAPTNRFQAQGSLQQSTFTLDPIFISAGETVITLSSSGNLNRLEGELLVDNLPVEIASAFYELPVSVTGDLDVVTQFGGSLANPRITGEALVADTKINEQPIDRVGAEFSYRNAVVNLDGTAAIDPNEAPITVTGTIPYALPFMAVRPTTDRITAKAIVPSDTFDFVNVLTDDQVRWESGSGEVVVQVGGTLANPAVAGEASFQDGVISSAQLGDDITDLNGNVQFNLERIGIQQLGAAIGDGSLAVSGQLPLLLSGESLLAQAPKQFNKQDETSSGLLIALNELPLDYSGILQAELDGQVVLTGAVLAPTVGGGIEIGAGNVNANELLRQAGAIDLPTSEELEEINPYRAQYLGIDPFAPESVERPEGFADRVQLDNFRVEFSDRLTVAGQPFYNISADGGLTVNGTLANLQPDGEIALRSGWINLFSTQFRLDSNAPNTATFIPEDGLDPYVNVVLSARVQDTDVSRVPPTTSGFASSEISDNNIESIGRTEFINVEAIAMGYASNLQDSLALTSTPSRSQEELVALLGSSVAGGLAGTSLTQFAGFLGAGSLAGFGNDIADTLGLRSFSVFPTTDTSTESTAGVGIGVEASFAIGNSIGINVLEILNSGNPPQLGLQYRLTEELEIRGSSNLNDTEMRLEYRTEF